MHVYPFLWRANAQLCNIKDHAGNSKNISFFIWDIPKLSSTWTELMSVFTLFCLQIDDVVNCRLDRSSWESLELWFLGSFCDTHCPGQLYIILFNVRCENINLMHNNLIFVVTWWFLSNLFKLISLHFRRDFHIT